MPASARIVHDVLLDLQQFCRMVLRLVGHCCLPPGMPRSHLMCTPFGCTSPSPPPFASVQKLLDASTSCGRSVVALHRRQLSLSSIDEPLSSVLARLCDMLAAQAPAALQGGRDRPATPEDDDAEGSLQMVDVTQLLSRAARGESGV